MHQTSQHVTVEDLAEEYLSRRRNGERPTIAEFVARHPSLAEEIQACFPALQMVEDCKPASEPASDPPELSVSDAHLRQLGDFRIVREVGRGGMGVVYEAEQVSLGRRVALKVLPQQLLAGQKQRKRFEREAKAAARLHHTNIVPVFGVGEQEGLHYYVMQFIHGQGLDEVIVELRHLREQSSAGRATTQPRSPHQDDGPAPRAAAPASAVAVAHSLLTDQFERTVLVQDLSDSNDSDPSTLNSQPSTLNTPPDTAVGRLSETVDGPGQFALPGKSGTETRDSSRKSLLGKRCPDRFADRSGPTIRP